ncbi:EAL domain-containing protein [Actinocorallia sp. A-T 12471]|uniref:EAL domain-containing protein n=1 Tax=Actinocorallia sp. A-T 12471 TaxID=3089813 RepID=UPI0029D035C6|nr:EAL domain-containing protein [Actinocorallia sp. A-T 12471]MDX6740525.1 EAL domain-containing protein [Actinocorallia sp. A-T 12471]
MAVLDTPLSAGVAGGALFEPVLDLDAGAVVAVAAHAGPPPGLSADPAAEDVRRAVEGARALGGVPLPLRVALRAETLALGRAPLTRLHHGLHEAGRRPRDVIVCITGGFPPAVRSAVAAGVSDLRHAGYPVAFGGLGAAHAPLDLLIDGTPSLVELDRDLARRAVADPRRAALVAGLVTVAHRVGTRVLAPGVQTEEQLAKLRALGVRLMQGPLLTPPDWRPGQPVRVPVPVTEEPDHGDLGPRVSEFTLPAVTMPDTANAGEVLEALAGADGVSSIVLVDERLKPRATVNRSRFLLTLSGPFGHALHAAKPAARLADQPRLVPRTVPAVAALRAAGRDEERVYDDLVVIDEIGRCQGVVRVADLIRALSR